MPVDGHGLHIVNRNEADARLKFYRFQTAEIGWPPGPAPGPGINVVLPTGFDPAKRYPVLYLLHGGMEDFRTFDTVWNIRQLTVDRPIIIVTPDGGNAGWYSNPVRSNVGPRNWENFHINQLIPWIDDNFPTHANKAGRAVGGFSMGGFGALKYAGKYPNKFASTSAYSGPASLRHNGGIVTHWANLSSFLVELGFGAVYGVPWDEAKVKADDPCEDVNRYKDTRIFLVSGDSPDPLKLFDFVNEKVVRETQKFFVELLRANGMAPIFHTSAGGHTFRPTEFVLDLDGIIAHLTPAG